MLVLAIQVDISRSQNATCHVYCRLWLRCSGVLPGATEYRVSVDLINGTFHDIVIEYKENDGAASIQVGFFVGVMIVEAVLVGSVMQRRWHSAFSYTELFR